jgi:hypothetical protein
MMPQRRSQQPSLFDTLPTRAELSALQRTQARVLLEVLLMEAIGETPRAEGVGQREVDHDKNIS